MATGALFELPGFTQENYEAVLAAVGEEPPDGSYFHISGPIDGGWRVIEVWDSEDEAQRFFQEQFVPALRALGLDGPHPPRELWPVHNAMK